MAINTIKATMQMRRGIEDDFDPSQMTAGEWAVSTDSKYVRMCFMPGLCLRMATYEAFEEDMERIQEILKECQDIRTAVERFVQLAEQHKTQAEHYSLLSRSWAVGGTGGRPGEDTNNSMYYSRQSESYAHGGTGLRVGEDTDNSEYYSRIAAELVEEAKKIIAVASQGGIIPAGTIPFEKLPESPLTGFMYNISNDFITDDRFEDGAGIYYTAGNNVYWNVYGKWDVLTGVQSYDFIGMKAELEEKIKAGEVVDGMKTFLFDGGSDDSSGGEDNSGDEELPEDLKERIEALEEKTKLNAIGTAGIVAAALAPARPGLSSGYPLERALTYQQVPSYEAEPRWTIDWRYEGGYNFQGPLSAGTDWPKRWLLVDPLLFEVYFEYIDADNVDIKSTVHRCVYDATFIYRSMQYYGNYGKKAGYDASYVNESRKITESFSLYRDDTYSKIGDFVVTFHFYTDENYELFVRVDNIQSTISLTTRKYLFGIIWSTGTSKFA